MPEPPGLVVKNGTNRFSVLARPGPSSSTQTSTTPSSATPSPTPHAAAGLERRVDGVAHQVDEQLVELIAVGLDA